MLHQPKSFGDLFIRLNNSLKGRIKPGGIELWTQHKASQGVHYRSQGLQRRKRSTAQLEGGTQVGDKERDECEIQWFSRVTTPLNID